MWLLPTRGRQKLCQEMLDACMHTGMTSPLVIIVDSRVDKYEGLRFPPNTREVLYAPWDMADCMRYLFWKYPQEESYGWLSDDLLPHTRGWDKALERTAGHFFLADCEDLYLTSADHTHTLCGAFCWGGDLVRAVGWWALPGVRQAGIDDAWCDICTYELPELHRFRGDILVEHRQYKNGKREKDETDNWARNGEEYVASDFETWHKWRRDGQDKDAVARIRAMMARAGVKLEGGNLVPAA